MSELITSPGTGLVFPEYNLTVTSEGTIVLSIPGNPGDLSSSTRNVTGSDFADFIAPLNPNDPVVYNINAGAGNDTVTGGISDDFIAGGAGDDALSGGEGNDNLEGGDGNDVLVASGGLDLLEGGAGNDTIDGGAGNDALIGGAGNDRILGGEGNDSLQGGVGKDSLTGGSGRDEFRFERGTAGGVIGGPASQSKINKALRQADVITDFNHRDDTIQLDRRLFKGAFPAGELDSDNFLKVKDFKKLQADVRSGKLPGDTLRNKIIYETGSGVVYYSRNSNETTVLVQLGNKPGNLAANDFELFY